MKTNKVLSHQAIASNYHLLHQDSKGIICMVTTDNQQWQQRYGRYKAIEKMFLELDDLENVFFSQNTFKRFKKSGEHLFELKALYLDIDYYRTHFTREQVLFAIDDMVKNHQIPMPTQIIDSGNGLYLIWRIKRLPAMAVKLWRAVSEYLFVQFEHLGADRKSLEPTRVLRLSGSVNAKYSNNKKIVNIISTYPFEYDIHDLQFEYLQPCINKRKNKSPNNQRKVILFKKNIYSLYCSRRDDILSLCKLRNYEMTGIREYVLFLYRYYSCLTVTSTEEALEMVTKLNDKFTQPCAFSTVNRATRSAEKAAAQEKYNYRNQTLVDLLHITDEEMMAQDESGNYILKEIITKDIKYKRNNLRRQEIRRNEAGLTKTQQSKIDNLKLIKELRELGLTQKAIAQELGISLRQVQNYCSDLKNSNL